jgi:hypothetical protein
MISYQLSVDSKKDPECLFCDGQVTCMKTWQFLPYGEMKTLRVKAKKQ